MELSLNDSRVIANALTEGQGSFSEDDFAFACLEIIESLTKAQFAALALEGKLAIKIEDGELKYATSKLGEEELNDHLAERGISAEQLAEELRRGKSSPMDGT